MTTLEMMRALDALSADDRENLLQLTALRDLAGLRQMKLEAFEAENCRAVKLLRIAIAYKRYQILKESRGVK